MKDRISPELKLILCGFSILVTVVMWDTVISLSNYGVGFPIDEFGQNLVNFPNRQVLINFLDADTTDQNPYTNKYDCTEFSMDLKKNARDLGYRVRCYVIIGDKGLSQYNILLQQYFNTSLDMESGGSGHVLCKAYIDDEDLWVTIEPQGDLILNCTI